MKNEKQTVISTPSGLQMIHLSNLCAIAFIATVVITIFLISCSKDNESMIPIETDDPISAVIARGGDISDAQTWYRADTSEEFTINENGVLETCVEVTVSRGIASNDYLNYDPNAENYLGRLLKYSSLDKATPDPVPLRRGKGSISIGSNIGIPNSRQEVPEVTASYMREAQNEIIASYPSDISPAHFNLVVQEINAARELDIYLKGKAKFLFASASLDLLFNQDRNVNSILVLLDLNAYSMVMDRPGSIREFFHTSVSADDVSPFSNSTERICYISSMTYGIRYALLIESTSSMDSLKAAASANFIFGNVDTGTSYLKKLKNLSIKVGAMGGNAKDLLNAASTTDVSNILTNIQKAIDIRTAVPISYVVRSVISDKIAAMKLATEYTYSECELNSVASLDEAYTHYVANKSSVELPRFFIAKWKDNSDNHYHCIAPNLSNGFITGPSFNENAHLSNNAIYFPSANVNFGGIGGGILKRRAHLTFFGQGFNQSGYTLFLVMRIGTNNQNIPIFGKYLTGDTPDPAFQIGLEQLDQIFVQHGNKKVQTDLSPSLIDDFRIFTFNFSKEFGYTIYIDGYEIFRDANFTNPVQGINTAFLGMPYTNIVEGIDPNSTLSVLEFITFTKSLNEQERNNIEKGLIKKYQL